MSTYQHNCDSDYRNEGWTLVGSGVSAVSDAWGSIGDDSKYCKNPANKGRACVRFPLDISSGSIGDGSNIESVTIYIRANKTDSSTRSVTVNVLCSDDTSHFTSRTFNLSTTITTYEVGTYTLDALGKHWDKDRLNRVMLQCFSYCGISDKVRVYEAYCVVNYRNKPTVKVTAPSGTVDSAAPTVSWTYTQADGDPQKFAEYKIFTAAQQEATTFNPDNTPALYPSSSTYTVKPGDSLFKIAAEKLGNGNLWPSIYHASTLRSGDPNLIYPGEIVTIPGVASITGDITSFTLPFALAANDYYIYVRATSTRNARSDWANRTFTISGAAPGIPGGSLGGVGTGGGGGFESVIADGPTSNAFLSLRDGSNMLGLQASSFETTTDSLDYTATNATLAQDTTQSYGTGGASMKMTASSAATMSAQSGFMDISPSAPVTARAQFISAVTGRTCNVNITFWDASYASVGGTVTGTGADVTTTWTEVVATGTVPINAVYAQVQLQVVSPANAEVHNVDHVGLMYGTNSAWSDGGHASRNLLTSSQSTADDPITVEPYSAASGSTYSRVTTTGTGAHGSKAFKMLYAGISPSISFVATGTAFTDTTTGTGYTLNKPAGVANGDVLVAYVASNGGGAATPPTGWTLVDNVALSGSSDLSVLMRDGLAADPASWTGNLASSCTRKRATVVAYRGAASTGLQFPQENVSSSLSGSTTVSTASVSNGDAAAWRLSAFAVNDNAGSGAMTANITPASTPAPIAYVGKAGVWKDTTGPDTSYTINKPSGVVSGDLMIASLALSGNVTVTAPSGWTLTRTIHKTISPGDEHSGSTTLAILTRTAGGSEPSSWTGSHTATAKPKITQCVAYRNAEIVANQYIAENGQGGSDAYPDTPTVTNTNSKAWRISIFAMETDTGGTMTSNENSERCDDSTSLSGYPDLNLGVYDSNTTVSTGSHTRSATSSNHSIFSTASWIGIIKPLASGPAPGANETERQDATAGASNPWITLAAYDSNGVAATGSTTVYGTFTPGSGSGIASSCAWLGFLIPATPTVTGEVGATLVDYVDISSVSSAVRTRAGNQMTVQASFLGSTAGVPHLKMYAYVGNELTSTQVAECDSFNTTIWNKGIAQFVLPPGTTRLKLGVAAADRAVNDYVLFNRVSIAFGSDTVWRSGTGKAAHPIFDVPVIEYAEDLGDGYGDWVELPGTSSALLKYDQLTGVCTFTDQTIVPLSHRKYRAKTVSYGLAGDSFISDFGPESDEVTLAAVDWWLKDMLDPTNPLKLKVQAEPLKVGTADSSAVFQPLGADRPMVITEGYKGDVIPLTLIVNKSDYATLRRMFNSRRTLYLQSNMDNAWWVRPNGDISSQTQLAGYGANGVITNPIRFVDVTFVEVDPEV